MASPALSSMTASSSTVTIIPTATQLRKAALDQQHERRDPLPHSPLTTTSPASEASPTVGAKGGISSSVSFPPLGSALFSGTGASTSGKSALLPRSSTSGDLFGASHHDGPTTTQSWTSGQRQSEQRTGSLGNRATSWTTTGELSTVAQGRGRERSSTVASSASRTTASSLFPRERGGHDRHPSSATSAPAERSSSMYRTASNTTSSSTGSSDFPRTPGHLSSSSGAVVYRSSTPRSPLLGPSSRKGKEREYEPDRSTWRAGVPVLNSPTSPALRSTAQVRGLAPTPVIADPRFSFPMRRGGATSSSSGSGGASGSSQGLYPTRSQLFGLGFRSEETQPQLQSRTQMEPRASGEEARRRGSAGSVLGDSSFVATLAARPLTSASGRGASAPYPSYAATPVSLLPSQSSPPSLATPSLIVPSPVLPTSPVAPTFSPPETPPRSARRSPRKRRRSRKRAGRRHSTSSSSSSDTRAVRTRSASVPNLRKAAEGPHARRPSVQLEPRDPRTGSLEADRSLPGSLRRGSTPNVFPAKRATSRHRAHVSEPLAGPSVKPPVPPRTRRNVVPISKYEALIGTRPRVVFVDASSSHVALDSDEEPRLARSRRARHGALTDADVDLLLDDGDEGDRSSVRRVLREGALLQAERAAWSDSAMRGVGFGLSLRLAEQQQRAARRSLAVEQRKAERRRMRRDTAQRRRREAAEAESEAERSDGRLGPRRRLVAPDYSPPMPSSFEPFAQIGRKLSLGRIRERDAAIQGVASEGHGLGFVHALKRVTSRSHVRSASATSTAEVTGAPGYPSTPRTVRGQAIRHMHRSSSVDSLYARTQATAPAVPQLPHITNSATLHSLAAAVEQVTTQYGEALTLPGDQPSQPAGEMRRPSVMAQNAFLSLPPHLHHLLRSPERTRYMPARPAPSAPTGDGASVPPSRGSTPDSTASAARLSLALEEQLREMASSPAKSLEDLPVAAAAPLVWRARESSPQQVSPISQLASSRSAPALAASVRPSPSHPGKDVTPALDHPYAHRASGSTVVRRQPSELSRQSSSGSVVDLTSDGNWGELFFLQPRRPDPTLDRPSASIETADSAPSFDTSRNFRLGSDAVSPTPDETPASRPPAPSFAVSAAPSPATRPSTSQTRYTTADEAVSSLVSSPEQRRLGLPSTADSPLSSRPLPTPVQGTWASTSFAREYLGTSATSLRNSHGSGSGGSSRSFLRVADGSGSEPDAPAQPRQLSPSSFMEFSPPPSPRESPVPTSLVLPFSPLSPFAPPFPSSSALFDLDSARTPASDPRSTHLSIDSRYFVTPGHSSSSPGMASDGSRFSTLDETMDDFPAPPLLGSSGAEGKDSAASDGDDEDEGDEGEGLDEDVTISRRPLSIDSLPVHTNSARAGVPKVGALAVVDERPVSSQSWLDLSDTG